MSKIAFIDLDGVVANSDARFAMAENVADSNFTRQSKDWTSQYWHNVFLPERVILDTPIDGAYDALNTIEKDHELIFLSSRPEYMREATAEWLRNHRLLGTAHDLFMKPASMQYIKTVVWKAGLIHTLAFAYGASEVLVIDDEQMNLDELGKYTTPFKITAFQSLDMKSILDEMPDEHPF